jgi:pimeloyl-ACP methyl ester carboxylesterase
LEHDAHHAYRQRFPARRQQASVSSVLFVHGAFLDGSCWAKVILLLKEKGISAIALQNPLRSLADDVAVVRRALTCQNRRVLLVGHSWGGAVITEAGDDPKVAGLLYVAACAPDAGESFEDWARPYLHGAVGPELRPYGEDGYLALTKQGIRKTLAPDIPGDESDLLYATQAPIAMRCFSDKLTKAAWRSKPTWHIVAENDYTIPPAAERDSAARMDATTLTLLSSGVPMLSQPKAVAGFILEAASMLDDD